MFLQSDLAGERSQSAAENKIASEHTFVCFFSTKHGSVRITVGRWLPKETLLRSTSRLGGGPSFDFFGMLLRFTDSQGVSPYLVD
ncbi:unnamed protein product [Victoria cruziana]